MSKPQFNRNGIPVVVTPPVAAKCVNRKNGRPKLRFTTRFEAERYIVEAIAPPERRALFSVYGCPAGGHFHLTTQGSDAET